MQVLGRQQVMREMVGPRSRSTFGEFFQAFLDASAEAQELDARDLAAQLGQVLSGVFFGHLDFDSNRLLGTPGQDISRESIAERMLDLGFEAKAGEVRRSQVLSVVVEEPAKPSFPAGRGLSEEVAAGVGDFG
jgi:hypothetical protein